MGKIKQFLAKTFLPKDCYFSDKIRIEKAEYIHFHWRDVRILLTAKQFVFFEDMIGRAYFNWDGCLGEEDFPLVSEDIPDGIIFDKEVCLEEQENGDIHFHYQDIRIELAREEFMLLANLFEEAKNKIKGD